MRLFCSRLTKNKSCESSAMLSSISVTYGTYARVRHLRLAGLLGSGIGPYSERPSVDLAGKGERWFDSAITSAPILGCQKYATYTRTLRGYLQQS